MPRVHRYWRDLAPIRKLDAVGFLGLIFLILSQLDFIKSVWGSWYLLLAEFGIALIVACILGQTIDAYLKRGLVEDAVAESIGYLLPDELKKELTWVYDQKFLVTQTFNVRLKHVPDEQIVIFEGQVIRVFTNISGKPAGVILSGGADEWFHPKGEAEITKCTYKIEDELAITLKPSKSETGLGYGDSKKEIEIKADKSVELSFAYRMFMPENSMELLTHRYPIINARVTVEADPSLVANVVYSHRDKYAETISLTSGFFSRELKGVLMPHQDVKVYWYRHSDIERRQREINTGL